MAEVAAGAGIALAVEQVVSTAAYTGAAGYAVGKPTMPLSATYTMIAHATDDLSQRSLARANHTLTVVANKAYIFGGNVGDKNNGKQIATNDMHAVTLSSEGEPQSDYHLIPAVPRHEGGKVPSARTMHAACAFKGSVAVYGGIEAKTANDEAASIWLFDPETSTWTDPTADNSESVLTLQHNDATAKDTDPASDANPGSRFQANLFAHENSLILYGGHKTSDTDLKEVWQLDMDTQTWSQLPEAPISTSNAALANGRLYLISSSDPMSSQLHRLNITSPKDAQWETITFPTNPIAPGPRPRENGGLLAISTGYGRNYLVYFLGGREKPSAHDESEGVTQWSDMWTLQIPASDLSVKPKLSLGEAIKPAKIKDAIRSVLPGTESGVYTWAEVQVVVPNLDQLNGQGKLHPGPRSRFGCDVMADGCGVVLWGGEDAKRERVGDGWIVRFE